MNLIIPLTGNGSRFVAAGYKKLKPFIKIHDIEMICWVRSMFPKDVNTILICRKEHYDKYLYVRNTLKNLIGKNIILKVDDWKKRGPAFDVLNDLPIDKDEEVLISYCDYFMKWSYKEFAHQIVSRKPDGAIPCYSGFHPHLFRKSNLYASCKVDKKNYLKEIKEKHQFNDDKKNDLYSPGIYYFKSYKIMEHYINQMIDNKDHINSEYYLSLPYNYMVKDGLKVWCPNDVKYFCQWGTPHDLEEYLYWNKCIEGWK